MAGLPKAEVTPPISWNLSEEAPDKFLSRLYLPQDDGTILSGDPGNADWLRGQYGRDARVIACSRRAVLAAIERRFREVFRKRAIAELAACEPQFSASVVITPQQIVVFAAIAFLGVWLLAAAPQSAGIAMTAVFGALFLANGIFRALLLWAGGRAARTSVSSAEESRLPVYSILVAPAPSNSTRPSGKGPAKISRSECSMARISNSSAARAALMRRSPSGGRRADGRTKHRST